MRNLIILFASLAFCIPSKGTTTVLLGNTTVVSGKDSDSPGGAEAFQFKASATGTVTSLSVYLDSASELTLGLYASSGTHPGTLLGQGSLAAPQSGWNTIAIPAANVTSGNVYWIALLSTGSINYRDSGSGCQSESSAQNNLTVLPATWSSGARWNTCTLSGYASGTVGTPPVTYSISGTITGASSATVTLSGAASATTNEDSSGNFSFSGLSSGGYTITPSATGYTFAPASQAVTVSSSNITGVTFTGTAVPPPPSTFSIAGVVGNSTDGPGTVLYLSGAATANTTANSSGAYSFANLSNGSYTVSPSKSGYTFTPTVQSVTLSGANVSGVNFVASAIPPPPPPPPPPTSIFYDNFGLNPQWAIISRAGDYSNSEQECYTPQNVNTANDQLILTFKPQVITCGDATHSPSQWNWTSGMVQWKSFNFTYGTVEVQAKMPNTSLWSAIWLLGSNCQTSNITTADNVGTCNWPQAGSEEIDIAEFFPGDTTARENAFRNGLSETCGTAHIGGDGLFHTYDLVWTSTALAFQIDGSPYCTITNQALIPTTPMFLMIDIAANTTPPTGVPDTLVVNYVKVTQP